MSKEEDKEVGKEGETNKFNHAQLPNKLFLPTEKEKSILQKIEDDNVLLILDYLFLSVNRMDISVCTLEDLILSCGYKKVDNNKNKNADAFRNILNKLQKMKIIKSIDDSLIDFNNIKPKTLIKLKLNLLKEREGFIQLYINEKEEILKQEIEKVDNKKLLIYYCYLKARMHRRKKGNDDINISGGRSEICFPSYKCIASDLSLSDITINKYNTILKKLDLIRITNAGLWFYESDKNKIVRESPNFYCLFYSEEDAKHQLEEGIRYFKTLEMNEGKIFTNKRSYKNNNRKVNGLKGSIIKKVNNGIATEKEMDKLEEIIATENLESENRIGDKIDK